MVFTTSPEQATAGHSTTILQQPYCFDCRVAIVLLQLLFTLPMCIHDYVLQEATAKIDEYARGMISGSGSTLFEELGLYYIGPIDGHNLDDLIAVLQGTSCLFCLASSRTRG